MEATFTARLLLKTSRFDGGWANASHFILCLYRNGMQVSNFLCFILLTVRTNHHHCCRRERIFAEKVGTVYRKTRPELQGWVGYLWRIHHLCTTWLLRKRCCFFFNFSSFLRFALSGTSTQRACRENERTSSKRGSWNEKFNSISSCVQLLKSLNFGTLRSSRKGCSGCDQMMCKHR